MVPTAQLDIPVRTHLTDNDRTAVIGTPYAPTFLTATLRIADSHLSRMAGPIGAPGSPGAPGPPGPIGAPGGCNSGSSTQLYSIHGSHQQGRCLANVESDTTVQCAVQCAKSIATVTAFQSCWHPFTQEEQFAVGAGYSLGSFRCSLELPAA